MGQTKITIVEQGAVQVNDAWVRRRGLNVVALDVDLRSKYCEPLMSCGTDLWVHAGEHSLHLDETKDRHDATRIRFDAFPADKWDMHAVQISRYTLEIVFVRRQRPVEQKLEELKHAWWRLEGRLERWWNGEDA